MMRVFIADDEEPARRRLRQMLGRTGRAEVVAEGSCSDEVLEALRQGRPDALFLDICMPQIDGISLLSREHDLPPVVFVTGHEHYAAKAFDQQAVDYLLKPVTESRLDQALDRLDEVIRKSNLQVGTLASEKLAVSCGDTVYFFSVCDIVRFHAADKYAAFFHKGQEYLVEQSLSALQQRFAHLGFIKTHRSELVNGRAILSLKKIASGGAVKLSDGQVASVSRRSYNDIIEYMGGEK